MLTSKDSQVVEGVCVNLHRGPGKETCGRDVRCGRPAESREANRQTWVREDLYLHVVLRGQHDAQVACLLRDPQAHHMILECLHYLNCFFFLESYFHTKNLKVCAKSLPSMI